MHRKVKVPLARWLASRIETRTHGSTRRASSGSRHIFGNEFQMLRQI